MANTSYCLSLDGAGVGTITSSKCTVPAPGGPIPFAYLVGPAATDKTAVANCASTNPSNGVQSFTKGACSTTDSNQLTFYSYASAQDGQVPLYFIPAPTGIQGTMVTTSPNVSGATMTLNFKYQNVTCADTGCGDHGTCTNGQCVCTDSWTGTQCEIPPSGNAGCVPDTTTKKSCGNLGSYGTCQASTTSGGITGSGNCTCDTMTGQSGLYCEQHCSSQNSTTACGGPLRGYCVDGNYNFYTNPNAVKQRCVCVNGWTGVDCTVPPPDWKCTADTDCTNLTTVDPTNTVPTGTCNKDTETCTCDNTLNCSSINTLGKAFTGQACQVPLPVQGASCDANTPCNDPQQTCVNGTCSCSNTPEPSGNFYAAVVYNFYRALLSPQGLATLLTNKILTEKLPLLLKYMTTKALEQGFAKVIEARLQDAVTGKVVDASASKFLENAVGKRLAAKVLAKMTAKELLESTSTSISAKVATAAFEEVFGFVGSIAGFAHMLGMLGTALDAFDVMGLNEESSQSQIDAVMYKFNASINSNKQILAYGLRFPVKQPAESTFNFQLSKLDTASRNQFSADAANYISHLTVNSNGAAIIPQFQTAMQQQQAADLAAAQGSVLYALSGSNMTVYQRLKQDWPIILAGILVALGALIGSAFGIRALVKKKKLSQQ